MNERQRAALYRSLARLLDAGLTRDSVYPALRAGHSARAVHSAIDSLEAAARAGHSLSEALEQVPGGVIPQADALVVRAAEPTGSVPDALYELAEAQERRLHARRDPMARAAYAVVLLHLAVLAPNAGGFVTDAFATLARIAWVLLPLDALGLLAWLAVRRPPRSPALAGAMLQVPVLGHVIRCTGYRTFFATLHRLVDAGVPLPRAVREALSAVDNPGLRQALAIASKPLDYGKPLSDALPRFPGLLGEVHTLITSGEPGGQLDLALLQAAALYGESEENARAWLAHSLAVVLYGAAALYVGAGLIAFYLQHFSGPVLGGGLPSGG